MEFERYAKFAPKRSKNKEPPKLKLFLERFGANFEYLLNSTNLQTFQISYTSNALIDIVEILFSREKVS